MRSNVVPSNNPSSTCKISTTLFLFICVKCVSPSGGVVDSRFAKKNLTKSHQCMADDHRHGSNERDVIFFFCNRSQSSSHMSTTSLEDHRCVQLVCDGSVAVAKQCLTGTVLPKHQSSPSTPPETNQIRSKTKACFEQIEPRLSSTREKFFATAVDLPIVQTARVTFAKSPPHTRN